MLEKVFSELKRRNVVRVAGVYVVTAWAIFQIAKTIFETLRFPEWASPMALVVLALGLPIALIISWAFERAPDGGVRRTEAAPEDAPKARLNWLDGGLIAAMGAVLLLVVLQATGVLGGGANGVVMGDKSVAVLPFATFSTKPETAYFADGLTEEVINSLAQVEDLKVAGRTSAFYFKGKNEDLREIGRKLGVAHVVEGSVRHEGGRLRVTAQLIKVSDGFHMWSETYDRNMNDAFAIQTEIAESVAQALKTELAVKDRPERAKRRNPEAYRLQLTARAQVRQFGLPQVSAAQAAYKRLMEIEPENAEGYAGYAYASALLVQHHLQGDFMPTIREAEQAIDKALKLDPNSASAYIAKGMVCRILFIRASRQDCDVQAVAAFKRAAELAPRNPEALSLYGAAISNTRPQEAITYLRRALAIDPLDRTAQTSLAGALAATGQFAEAERQYRVAIDLFPDFLDSKQDLGATLLAQGKLDEAEPWFRIAAQPGTDPSAAFQLAHLYLNLGLIDDMNRVLNQVKAPPVAVDVASAARLITQGRAHDLLTESRRMLARPDPDPLWRAIGMSAGALTGDFEFARTQLLVISPELFAPQPQVSAGLADQAVGAAYVMDQLGDRGQAHRVLAAVLTATEPTPGLRQTNTRRIARMKAFAMLGEKEKALAEMRAAIDNGYRTLYDLDMFLRLDAYPMLAPLKADPRFQGMLREVDTDVARMRGVVLARRKAAA